MNLLKINDFDEKQISDIFNLTDMLQKQNKQILKGKTLVLFFPESSIRTRITFEKGITDLGGTCILFPPTTLDKRESLEDVIKYIENWADAVIVRHSDYRKIEELSIHSSIPVINAMSSINHPCEILSDLYSISREIPDYRGLTYTFVGELGNISNSWRIASEVLKFRLNHVCVKGNEIKLDDEYYRFTTDLEKVLQSSDVILTDPLSKELKTDEYINKYQITLERMKLTKPNALLNPCPPFYRGEEVSADVIDSDYFVGHNFKKNLLSVQQAIILYCLGLSI
ncbi:MAG: peptide transporter [Clostridiales bacterium]|nr:peptide transporter [Clostridiales bacterium]